MRTSSRSSDAPPSSAASSRRLGDMIRIDRRSIRRRPGSWIAAAVTAFVAGGLLGARLAGIPGTLSIVAGLIGFLLGARRALLLWRVDELVFEPANQEFDPRAHRGTHLAIATIVLSLVAAAAFAQQTIFNVPTADVLDKGKVYVENDDLWRPQDPHFATFTIRGVSGFGANVEGGVNVGGLVTPGRSAPTATAAVKWQPLKVGGFALTTGAHGLFFLHGSKDGDPAGFFYAHGAYTFSTNTRLTAGGWVATPDYAAPKTTRGALAGLEQKLVERLNLIADWYSGENGIGYFTPGVSSTWGGFTLYAGYSFKNADSKGNAMLFELGFNF